MSHHSSQTATDASSAASAQPTARPDFRTLTTPQPAGPGEFTIDIPDTWQQGRGSFGGLVLAIMTRALRAAEPDDQRALRALTATLTGPVLVGPARLRIQDLRQGNAVSTRAVELTQPSGTSSGAEVLAHAVASFGRSRVRDRERTELARPEIRPWRECALVPIGPPMAPVFLQHCELRPLTGLPFSNQNEGVSVQGWVRFVAPGPSWDEAEVIAAVDAYWPAMLVREPAPRPMATLTFSAQMLYAPDCLPAGSPLFYRGSMLAAHDGYVLEQRELWTEQGDLVILNQQTMALVK